MNLKKLLESKNITMYQLAKEAELGTTTVNEIVTGKRKSIKLETAVKIASVLDIKVDEFSKCLEEGNECDGINN